MSLLALRKRVNEIQSLHFCDQKISFKAMERRIKKAYDEYRTTNKGDK